MSLAAGRAIMGVPSGQVRLDDLRRVCSTGDEVNHALVQEMLVMFIEDNARRVALAVAAASAGDTLRLRAVMHALKGSAALIGAERLRQLADLWEVAILNGSRDDAEARAREIGDEYTAVVRTLKTLYPDLAAD
jgi:HPt (histidine-containing phosphotransfer) domain-containing protein